MVTLSINNRDVEVAEGTSILDAASNLGIKVPTLCHFKLDDFDVESKAGSCRVCVVEVEGRPNLAPSCCTPVADGMKVRTNSVRAINARRTMLDLLLSNHPKECLTCERNLDCELQRLAAEMGLHHVLFEGEQMHHEIDRANESIVRDPNKCIMCRRCETACNEMQTVGILSAVDRGFDAVVMPTGKHALADTKCTFCGQCVQACPTGALTAVNRSYDVWRELNHPSKFKVVQTAPAVRVALGEAFGLPPGSVSTGKMVAALRQLGFDRVFDTDFAADLTIMEETTELIGRLTKKENLPILTSCCPGWVKFFEHQFPDLINIPSSAKSPQQMFGAIAKTYYADKAGVSAADMLVVSVMPCLAKKYEASRDEFAPEGIRDVDIVISTRELATMIKEAGIQFNELEDSDFDHPLGESSGAGVIFGATGGVLEAALRTAASWLSDEPLESVDFTAVRGLSGIREATVTVAGMDVRVAIASGLGNARHLLEQIQSGKAEYEAIEIMACPGGCINGGGQPSIKGDTSILEKRRQALYDIDGSEDIRMSHENPSIKKLYQDFLTEPGSELAHKLLHTHYTSRENA
jgi:NADH-quinone oxidoreductase subunit G